MNKDCSISVDPVGLRVRNTPTVEGVRPTPNECPVHDTQESDGDALVMLELLGMWNSPFIAITPISTLLVK